MTLADTQDDTNPVTPEHPSPAGVPGRRPVADPDGDRGAARDRDAGISAEVGAMVEAVVRRIRADHQGGRPAQVVVAGGAGSGVSTVLRAAARRCGSHVLVAPARAACEGGRGMERLLVACLRAGGVPEHLLPTEDAALARLWVRHCALTAPTLLVDDLGADHRWGARLASRCPRGALLIGTHVVETAERLAEAGFTLVRLPSPTDDDLATTIATRAGDAVGREDVSAVAAACGGDRRSAVLASAALAAGERAVDVLAALNAAQHIGLGADAGPGGSWDPMVAMVLAVVEPGVGDLVCRIAAVGGASVSVEALSPGIGVEHPATTVRRAEWAGLLEEPSPGRHRVPSRVQAVFGTVAGGWLDMSPGRVDERARVALRAITSHYLLRLAAADVLLGGRVEHRLHPAYATAAQRAHELLGSRERAREWMLAEHDTLAILSDQLHHVVRDDTLGEYRVERELLAGLGEADRAWRAVGDRHSWQGVTRRALHAATALAPRIAAFVHATHYADSMLTGEYPLTASDRRQLHRLLADALAHAETGNRYWRARALCLRAVICPANAAQDLAAAHDLVDAEDPDSAARVALARAREALRRGPAHIAVTAAEHAVAAGGRVGGAAGAEIEGFASVVRAAALLDIDPAHAAAAAHQLLDRLNIDRTGVGEHAALPGWWAHHLAATALDRAPIPWPVTDRDTSARSCPHCTQTPPRQRAAAHRAAASVMGPGWPEPVALAPDRSTDAATTAATAAATVGIATSFRTRPTPLPAPTPSGGQP